MRHILVDFARARLNLKRGGDAKRISLDETLDIAQDQQHDFVALDDALNTLAKLDAQQTRIIELRFFAGLSIEETSRVLGVSPATVKRGWTAARIWLSREMRATPPHDA